MPESGLTTAAVRGIVRFRSGCLLPFLLIALGFLGWLTVVALDERYEVAAGHTRYQEFLAALADMRWDGISLPLLALTALLGFEILKLARRWVDTVALTYDHERVVFHPTLYKKSLKWSDVARLQHRAGGVRSDLLIELKSGRRLRVRNCEEDDVARLLDWYEEARRGQEDAEKPAPRAPAL
ncbi:hypothetical protein AM2010_680 [Pelagerythrobacter marensis]|uniref:DUF304 domain-containing protein n=1 Tax=Pelagerythrobacter marensis TaxID=543877 RepID=A0A0G3X8R6_9SPHN|nr:hypothetical protein AM2010_680 [Pelagerythrobacter marensis]